jgi:hypothetical protein
MTEETSNTMSSSFTDRFIAKLNKPDDLEEYLNSEEGALVMEEVLLKAYIRQGEKTSQGRETIILQCRRETGHDNVLFVNMAKFDMNRSILISDILRCFLAKRKILIISYCGHDYRFKFVSDVTQSTFFLNFEGLVLFN